MNKNCLTRITALWAFAEAFPGGMLHGFKVPFAGLVLSFIASVCITVIAMADKRPGAIIKSTLIVLAVKFVLSPYTPPLAYLAVLMQGLAGECLFARRRFMKPASFILSVFALLWSAMQFLLTMTIVFGKNVWVVLDDFMNDITKSFIPSAHHYSAVIAAIYIGCYLLAGIGAGILNIHLVNNLNTGKITDFIKQDISIETEMNFKLKKQAKKKKPLWLQLTGVIAFLLLVFSYLPQVRTQYLDNRGLEIIVRSIFILLTWLFFISPLLATLIAAWSARFRKKNPAQFKQVLNLLPEIRNIINYSWKTSNEGNRLAHLKKFITTAVWLTAYYEPGNTDSERTDTKR